MRVLLFSPEKSDLSQIPLEYGVYKMLGAEGEVLYVGKAKRLRDRVRSYFSINPHPDLKTRFLVSHIVQIEVLVASSEHHALILENQLIKLFRPRYNIALKDDKQYPYIKITNELYPRVLMVRYRKKDGAHYFGPYASFGSAKVLLKHIHDLFPFRDCKQRIDAVSLQPKCINLDIGKCLGPCVIKTELGAYQNLVNELILLLKGKNQQLLGDLLDSMHKASAMQAYEKAALYRDRYQKLSRLVEQKLITVSEEEDCQVWVKHESLGIRYVLVQTFLSGVLVYQRGFYQDVLIEDTPETFCIQSFFSVWESEECVPTEVVVSSELADFLLPVLEKMSVKVTVPKRGEKKSWIDLAERNAELAVMRLASQKYTCSDSKKDNQVVNLSDQIQELFDFAHPIVTVFGFDISHLSGVDIVASSVCFRDGLCDKAGYRKFNIRSVASGESHDPLSIYEAVKRRLMLCDKDSEPLPDLILVDGGLGQLRFAQRALEELNVQGQVSLLSLAKREELIYQVGSSDGIRLSRRHDVLRYFQQIRDESHRFANTFQNSKRRRKLKSVLLSIEGLGVKRVNALYQKYKTLDNMMNASVEDLAKIGNMGMNLAQKLQGILRE